MAGTGVIELGQVRPVAEDEAGAPAGSVRGLRATLAVALVLVLAGSPEPARPAFVALADIAVTPAAVTALSPHDVFLADRVAGAAGPGFVAAYALPGGRPRWQTPIPQTAEGLWLAGTARVVLASSRYGTNGAPRTVALDAGTGDVLWSSVTAGFVDIPAGSAGGLLVDRAGGARLGWADLRSGLTSWSRPVPAGAELELVSGGTAPDPVRVLLVAPDGAVELLAERTGTVLAAGRVTVHAPHLSGGEVAEAVGGGQLPVADDRVVVLRGQDPGGTTLAAFALPQLSPQWTVTGDFYDSPCGPMVCLSGTGGLTVLDERTGAVTWRSDRWQAVLMVDSDRLLVLTQQVGVGLAVLDVRTGRVLTQLADGWTPVYDTDTTRISLVVRQDPGQRGRFWFASLDGRRAAPVPLGYLPQLVFQNCSTAGDLLACDTPRHTVQIWRYGS